MRRNDITKAVGGGMFAIAMATCSGLAAAQDTTASPRRVGFLSGFGCSTDANPSPFRLRLAELGWVDGKTVILDCVSTVNLDQVDALAAELVARRPDVLAAQPQLREGTETGDGQNPDRHGDDTEPGGIRTCDRPGETGGERHRGGVVRTRSRRQIDRTAEEATTTAGKAGGYRAQWRGCGRPSAVGEGRHRRVDEIGVCLAGFQSGDARGL